MFIHRESSFFFKFSLALFQVFSSSSLILLQASKKKGMAFRGGNYIMRRCDLTGAPLGLVMQKKGNIELLDNQSDNFAGAMVLHGVRRGFMMTTRESKQPLDKCSHGLFAELHKDLEKRKLLSKGQEALFFEVGDRTRLLFMVALCNTNRGAGSGGVRLRPYRCLWDQIFDTVRLAEGMAHKNAMAGLWWGGGKGTIATENHSDKVWRAMMFEDWGDFVSGLQGAYYTAEDMNTTVEDMKVIATRTRFVNCIPKYMGGSDNPSHMTAIGVLRAMEAALAATSHGSLAHQRVAVQGLGNVGSFLVEELLAKGVTSILATDTDLQRLEAARERFHGRVQVRVESEEDSALFADVDIVAPCAVGAVLNDVTIPKIRAPIICGAANNQLLDVNKHGAMLTQLGKTYVPDFVCNCMGIVNCSAEVYGYVGDQRLQDPMISRHLLREGPHSIYQNVLKVLARTAERPGLSTAQAAREMAEEACQAIHPLWPGRAREIQLSLATYWAAPTQKARL